MYQRTVCFVAVLSLLLCVFIGQALAASSDPTTAAPFAYTTKEVTKSDEWKKQPITYEDWAEGADLAVSLDQHLYQVMLPLINQYARDNKMHIAVKEGTCGISYGAVNNKTSDIAGFCCPAGPIDRLPSLRFHTVGIAPLAIIVHEDNPVDDVTDEQVRKLFSGDIRNWLSLESRTGKHGKALPVKPIARLHCKARPGHWKLILPSDEEFGSNVQEVGAIPDMVSSVASYQGAVGHLATWNIYAYRSDWRVKALRINGISPENRGALLRNEYPYYRAYNITTWEGNPRAEKLVRYLLDNAGRLDEKFSMIPAAELRKAGWLFEGDELIGEPPAGARTGK